MDNTNLNKELKSKKEVIEMFKERGINVKSKEGYGNTLSPYWSSSLGGKDGKILNIK